MPRKSTSKVVKSGAITYTVVHSKRKRGALVVETDGSLVVRVPLRTSLAQVEEIVHSKMEWILQQQAKMKQVAASSVSHKYQEGEKFWFLGKQYALEIDPRARNVLKLTDRFTLKTLALARAEDVFTQWYKKQAMAVFTARVAVYASEYGFSPEKIRISSARTRWGSCSTKKTLSFTWRLVMAPADVIDYVVVHELAHLTHPNHSPAFWQSVEAILPDYRKRRAWLKKNGRLFTL
jgi:predicted metal-dependent hydrolase